MPKRLKKKNIWCVWGHDLYANLGKVEGARERIKLIARRIGDLLINYETKYYKGIGIGFKYDALEVKSRFKNKTRILMCPYPSGMKLEEIDSIIEDTNSVEKDKDAPTKIMVAHSAHQYLHHKEMLKKLSAYKDENIIISLVLVYGNVAYATSVAEYAKSIFSDKVEVFRNRMDEKDYIRYLTTIDIGIFDQVHQSSLGNLNYLLYMGKKLYLNKDGVLRLAFLLEGIYPDTTDKLGLEPYEKFIRENLSKEGAKSYAAFIMNEKNQMDMWKSTIDILE